MLRLCDVQRIRLWLFQRGIFLAFLCKRLTRQERDYKRILHLVLNSARLLHTYLTGGKAQGL